MKTLRVLCAALLFTAWSLTAAAADWKVGLARTDITPAGPTWMAGYAARTHPSEGTVHPLWAKALVLEDQQGGRAVIVTTDLIGLTREVCDTVAAQVLQQTGIERERILFNSSHTHCGPVVLGCADIAHHMEAEDVQVAAAYRDEFEEKLVGLITEACAKMQPATLACGQGEATFAMNRRKVRGGGYSISPNPQGPVDHAVPVLLVRGELWASLASAAGALHALGMAIVFHRVRGIGGLFR
jgi:hypothetical protein